MAAGAVRGLLETRGKNTRIEMKIGEAAKAGAFDWSDERLTPLREFIQEKMC